jgi:branched-chain amino acid aminotransferase
VDAIVVEDFDRAAPLGVGNVKAAGNYAPDVLPSKRAKQQGYSVCLYLDAKTRSFVEEFSTSNFIGVTADHTIVTPQSPSILPSCTRAVVLQAAADLGMKVESRPIAWDEVRSLREVAACGTAVVLTPLKSITRGAEVIQFGGFSTIQKLYAHITALQSGDAPDPHGYRHIIKL